MPNRYTMQANNPTFNPLSIEEMSMAGLSEGKRDATVVSAANAINTQYDVFDFNEQAASGQIKPLEEGIETLTNDIINNGGASKINELTKLRDMNRAIYDKQGDIYKMSNAKKVYTQSLADAKASGATLEVQQRSAKLALDNYKSSGADYSMETMDLAKDSQYMSKLHDISARAANNLTFKDKVTGLTFHPMKGPSGEIVYFTKQGGKVRHTYTKAEAIRIAGKSLLLDSGDISDDMNQQAVLGIYGGMSAEEKVEDLLDEMEATYSKDFTEITGSRYNQYQEPSGGGSGKTIPPNTPAVYNLDNMATSETNEEVRKEAIDADFNDMEEGVSKKNLDYVSKLLPLAKDAFDNNEEFNVNDEKLNKLKDLGLDLTGMNTEQAMNALNVFHGKLDDANWLQTNSYQKTKDEWADEVSKESADMQTWHKAMTAIENGDNRGLNIIAKNLNFKDGGRVYSDKIINDNFEKEWNKKSDNYKRNTSKTEAKRDYINGIKKNDDSLYIMLDSKGNIDADLTSEYNKNSTKAGDFLESYELINNKKEKFFDEHYEKNVNELSVDYFTNKTIDASVSSKDFAEFGKVVTNIAQNAVSSSNLTDSQGIEFVQYDEDGKRGDALSMKGISFDKLGSTYNINLDQNTVQFDANEGFKKGSDDLSGRVQFDLSKMNPGGAQNLVKNLYKYGENYKDPQIKALYHRYTDAKLPGANPNQVFKVPTYTVQNTELRSGGSVSYENTSKGLSIKEYNSDGKLKGDLSNVIEVLSISNIRTGLTLNKYVEIASKRNSMTPENRAGFDNDLKIQLGSGYPEFERIYGLMMSGHTQEVNANGDMEILFDLNKISNTSEFKKFAKSYTYNRNSENQQAAVYLNLRDLQQWED